MTSAANRAGAARQGHARAVRPTSIEPTLVVDPRLDRLGVSRARRRGPVAAGVGRAWSAPRRATAAAPVVAGQHGSGACAPAPASPLPRHEVLRVELAADPGSPGYASSSAASGRRPGARSLGVGEVRASRRRGRPKKPAVLVGVPVRRAARRPAAVRSGSSSRTAASPRIRCRRATADERVAGPGPALRGRARGEVRAVAADPGDRRRARRANIRSVTRIVEFVADRPGSAAGVEVAARRGDRRAGGDASRGSRVRPLRRRAAT